MALELINGVLHDPNPTSPVFRPGGPAVHYRPTDVGVLFGALPLHLGVAAGTFITARRVKRTWKSIKGCDGEGIRVRTNNFAGVVTLTLRQGAAMNDELSRIAIADEISGVLAPPMIVGHINGRSIYSGLFASIEGPPDMAFGTEENDVSWTFLCDTWIPFTGGFNPFLPTKQ